MAKWLAWKGVEVEGRLRGAPTLFLHRISARQVGPLLANNPRCCHIWCCKEFVTYNGIEEVEALLPYGLVSIEVDEQVAKMLTPILRTNAHLVAAIAAPKWLRDLGLKDSDEIRLDYNLFGATSAPVSAFYSPAPAEYSDDDPLVYSSDPGEGQDRP